MKKYIPLIKDFITKADMLLFTLCIIATLFGIVVISSATAAYEGGNLKYILVQIIALIIGIALFVLLTIIDIDIITDKWPILVGVSFVLILALIPFGVDDGTGNKSWIRFLGIGIQPSEIVKVIYIALMAKHISYLRQYKNLNHIWSVLQLAGHFVLPFAMIIVVSGDLGNALIFFSIFLIMVFTAGLKIYWFVLGIAGVSAIIPFAWDHILKGYQKERLLAPYVKDASEAITWQANQSKLALASGRLTGSGLFNGTQIQSHSVPAQHTDFIFAAIGEELGMIGCIAVIILLTLIMIRCIQTGLRSKNTMSCLVCFGVAGTLFFQTFINLGMCIGLTPVIGLALPFFSYGGSSIFTMFAAMGLVSGAKYRPKPERFRKYD